MHDTQSDRSADLVPEILEREMRLIREAIALVDSGGSPRVVLSNIQFGEALLDAAQRLAADTRVRVIPLWRSGEGADLAVERVA
jgi:hypothetical protein